VITRDYEGYQGIRDYLDGWSWDPPEMALEPAPEVARWAIPSTGRNTSLSIRPLDYSNFKRPNVDF